jgi:hypothetical protein
MSQVMNGYHGRLTDQGQPVFPSQGSLEETCYQCHPGKTTKCLRRAMGGAGIVCLGCHGSLLALARLTAARRSVCSTQLGSKTDWLTQEWRRCLFTTTGLWL